MSGKSEGGGDSILNNNIGDRDKGRDFKGGMLAIRPIVANKGYVYRPSFAINSSRGGITTNGYGRGGPFRIQRHHSFPRFIPSSSLRGGRPSTATFRPMSLSSKFNTYPNSGVATKWIRQSLGVVSTTTSEESNLNVNVKEYVDVTVDIGSPVIIEGQGSAFVGNRIPRINVGNSTEAGSKSSVSSSTSSSSSSSTSGPMKPIVRLNNIHHVIKQRNVLIQDVRFKKVTNSKYKFKPILTRTRSPVKSNKFPLRFTVNGILKLSPRKNFSVRKYSLKRIRKSSISGRLVPLIGVSGDAASNSKVNLVDGVSKSRRKHSADLSTLFQQSQSVRRATRVVQKSKRILNRSKIKKNTFCTFFNKFGSCRRKNEGCPFIHDPRQVLVCSIYIGTGTCPKADCTLSHNLSIGKVPVCKFYREGMCSHASCTFRHVQVDSKLTSPSRKGSSLTKIPTAEKPEPTIAKQSNPKFNTNQKLVVVPNPTTSNDSIATISSRYFETAPDSQPIISIIPRRLRKEPSQKSICKSSSSSDSESDNQDNLVSPTYSDMRDISDVRSESGSSESEILYDNKGGPEIDEERKIQSDSAVIDPNMSGTDSNTTGHSGGDGVYDRRQRILQKVAKFKQNSISHNDNLKDHQSSKAGIQMPTFFKFN